MPDPIDKRIMVPLAPKAAFTLFTEGIDRWWPKARNSLSASSGKVARRVTLEPRQDGRLSEEMHDGQIAEWGRVTEWRPGAALALDWYVGRDPAEATKVRVTFTAVAGGTEVHLTHSGFEVLGADAETTAAGYRSGWDSVLGQAFREAAEAA